MKSYYYKTINNWRNIRKNSWEMKTKKRKHIMNCWLNKQIIFWKTFKGLSMRMKHIFATGKIGNQEISKLKSNRHTTMEDLTVKRHFWASVKAHGTVLTKQLLRKFLANLWINKILKNLKIESIKFFWKKIQIWKLILFIFQ